jgi:hypothetical protein
MIRNIILFFFLFPAAGALAQFAPESKLVIEELGWMDRNYLERQVDRIDQLARTRLGTQLNQNLKDLDLLQQIVDRELIDAKDTEGLQALGAVMAQLMLLDVPSLEWKIYIDEVGRSRALCAKNTKECLFPMTMLSRRMEVGLKPDVRKVYEEGLALLDDHVTHIPYGGGPERRLQR